MVAEPRVTASKAAAIFGCSRRQMLKVLRRWSVLYPADENGTYDARVLDLVRALRAEPHRALESVDNDWLARYLKELHARTERP